MNPLISTALAGLLSLGLASQSSALMFNRNHVQNAGHWTSMELSLGEERYFRASNMSDYPDTDFSVTFIPDDCRPQLELRVDMGKIAARDETVSADQGAMRVDRSPRHDSEVTLTRERGDSGAYAGFQTAEIYRLLHEMHVGDALRLKIGDEEPWYLAFQLAGAGSALDRAAAMCHEAKQQAPEDDQDREPEDFF
ncbi:hypothetical protein [Litchfieldella rifensis]|uniref:Uncharacterized protein n=1 Tax=Litchfieldella rifensis TaxID=762643 RepID=A0ABV7LPC1_9GAMM